MIFRSRLSKEKNHYQLRSWCWSIQQIKTNQYNSFIDVFIFSSCTCYKEEYKKKEHSSLYSFSSSQDVKMKIWNVDAIPLISDFLLSFPIHFISFFLLRVKAMDLSCLWFSHETRSTGKMDKILQTWIWNIFDVPNKLFLVVLMVFKLRTILSVRFINLLKRSPI